MEKTQVIPEKKNVTNRLAQTHFIGGGLLKDEIIEGYTVVNKLSSQTGEAEVFLAEKDGKKIVVKYYYPNFKPKVEILQHLLNLNHPNIIDIYGNGYYKERFFEIQDYAAGGTLGDKSEDLNFKYLPISEDRAIGIIEETIDAFKYFHAKGIVHRDIKPENLFLKNEDGTDILVGDFGISSLLDVVGGMSKVMSVTSRTEGYGAPEIYSSIVGKEVDYYALGITLYVLLTGEDPFSERSMQHVMRDTLEGRILEDLITRDAAANISSKMKKLMSGLIIVRHDKRWGYDEVVKHLSGEDVAVFHDVFKPKLPPFIFSSDLTIDTLEGMAKAISYDHDPGKKYLYRGMLEDWVKNYDQSLALRIGDLKEKYGELKTQEYGLIRLLYLLDPGLPLVLEDRTEIKNIADYNNYFKSDPDKLSKQLRSQYSVIHAWFLENGLEDYSKNILTLSKSLKSDKRFINIILLTNQGENFHPFEGTLTAMQDLVISKPSDLFDLPTEYRSYILAQMEDFDSILSIWLEKNTVPESMDRWFKGIFDHNWDNFRDIFSGNKILLSKLPYHTIEKLADTGDSEARAYVDKINREKAAIQRQKDEVAYKKSRLKRKLSEGFGSFIKWGIGFGIFGFVIGTFVGCIGCAAKSYVSNEVGGIITDWGLYWAMLGASVGFFEGYFFS
jgi:serine/threonine protein kinase